MSKKIVFANNKGGVLKTTLSSNLATYLSLKRKKILIIDTDTQNNIAYAFDVDKKINRNKTLYEVMFDSLPLNEAIYSYNDWIDILSVNEKWLDFEYQMQKNENFIALWDILTNIEHKYDYIIFDTEPKKSASTFSVLLSADEVIIPFELAKYSLIGIIELNNFINAAQQKNSNLIIKSFVPVKTIFNSIFQKDFYKNIHLSLPIKKVSNIKIPSSTKPEQSIIHYKKPILFNEKHYRNTSIYKSLIEYFDSLNYE